MSKLTKEKIELNLLNALIGVARLDYGCTESNSEFYKELVFIRDHKAKVEHSTNKGSQTKKQSFIEACTSTLIGFAVSLVATFLIFPLFGIESTATKNIGITICFTVVSIARGYTVRRFFNNRN